MPDSINWGELMRPQPEARAIGSAAISSTKMDLGNPGAEISQVLNQGLERQKMKQDLELGNQKLQSNAMALQTQKQQFQDAQTMRNANNQTLDNYLKVGRQVNGPLWYEAQKEIAGKIENVVNATSKQTAIDMGTIANDAHQAQVFTYNQTLKNAGVQTDTNTGKQFIIDPKSRQAIPVPAQLLQKAQEQGLAAGQVMYNHKISNLDPETQQHIKDEKLTEWSDGVNAFWHNAAVGEIAERMDKSEKDKPTTLMQNTQYIQDLKDKAKSGDQGAKDTLDTVKELDQKNQKGVSDYYDKELATQDAKTAATAFSTRQTMAHVEQDTDSVSKLLKQLPEGYTGPVVDYFKLNKMNTQVQELQKSLAEIPFLTKSLVGISNGMRFTQGELEQLNKASGSTAINKPALEYVMNLLKERSQEGQIKQYDIEKNIRSNGSPEIFKKWQDSNPDPRLSQQKEQSNNSGYSQEDLEHTAKIHNMTVDQVKAELAKRQNQ